MKLQVAETDPQRDFRWMKFVSAHPEATVYHHPAWLKVLGGEYGQKPAHLACQSKGGDVLAVLPMLVTRGLPFGLGGGLASRRYSSLPRTPLAGPLSIDPEATTAILRHAIAISQTRHQLQIKPYSADIDCSVDGLVATPWRFTYILELPKRGEGEFRIPDASERAKIKWALKKAKKSGIVVRPAETQRELREWYLTYLETMRRNVIPARSFRFFDRLWTELRPVNMIRILLAECETDRNKKIIAGSVFLMFGNTVSYAFSGMLRSFSGLRANDAIQWMAINSACQEGFQQFDFGEVPDGNIALAQFKTKWGAKPVRLVRYGTEPLLSMQDEEKTSKEALMVGLKALWRRLPLTVTAYLGDRIYSYM